MTSIQNRNDSSGTKSNQIRPIHNLVLLQLIKEDEKVTESGLIIKCNASDKMSSGIIIDYSSDLPLMYMASPSISIGQKVLFDHHYKENLEICDDRVLVPFSAIHAIIEEENNDLPELSPFFMLPPWDEFKGIDYIDWERFCNIVLFSVKVNYLEPFEDIKPLGRRAHECFVDSLRNLPELDLGRIRYLTDEDNMGVFIDDDVWDGIVKIYQKGSFIEFSKQATDIHNIHITCPRLLTALAKTLNSPEFKKIAAEDFSRVTNIVFRFKQRIKIEGRGSDKKSARNSELMQQFLLFQQKSTLDALALKPDDIQRIDIKVAFYKEIDGHPFRIFLNVQAPANDNYTTLDIEWEIQDHSPGFLPNRTYGSVLEDFFKNRVIRQFYKRWFRDNDDITCSTYKK
jgi:co-chaperonin GroES (HSP10)